MSNLVLTGLGNNSYDNKNGVSLYSEKEYKDMISKFVRFLYPKNHRKILRNEDLYSTLLHNIVKGHLNYDNTKMVKLDSYLMNCVKWTVGKFYSLRKNSVEVFTFEHFDSIPDCPLKGLENFEDLINKSYLKDREKNFLRMKFVEQMTFKEIGSKFSVSAARAEQIISKSIEKMKNDKTIVR